MNDKILQQLVIDELDFDPSIDAAAIGVAVGNGVVTLSGHVTDYAQKVAAERAAWRVKGVKAIAQEIEVRMPSARKQNDDEIAQRAVSILAWNTLVPNERIRVKVADGWVTLSGQVDWNYQRVAAEKEVRKLGGVVGVFNEIQLSTTAQPGDVKRRILDALNRRAEVEAEAIRVDVRADGEVRLEGRVDNWRERQAVEQAAWSAPGVRIVDDRLTIG